jgi:hypothetical protein
MPEQWNAQDPQLNAQEDSIGKLTKHILGKQFPGIDGDVTRAFSLFRFLVTHRTQPVSELRKAIVDNGAPMFSEEDLESMLASVNRHLNDPYVQRLLEGDGGRRAGRQAGGNVPVEDHTRNKFWDKAIHKIASTIGQYLPPLCDGWIYYIFMLHSLEKMDPVGPFISTALDTVTLSLPVLSDITSVTVSELIGLLPIPYAGIAGDVVGYVLGVLFLLFAITMNMSRKHFGSAFKVSLELFPIIGDIMAEAAVSFEVGAERYLINQDRMLKPLQPISPTAYRILDYYKPSVEPQVGPAPNWNFDKVKSEVVQYAEATLGVDKLLAAAANPMGAVTAAAGEAVGAAKDAAGKAAGEAVGAAKDAAGKAAGEAVGAAKDAAGAAVGKAKNAAVGAAKNAAVETAGKAKNPPGTAKILKKRGGGRRTLRNRK